MPESIVHHPVVERVIVTENDLSDPKKEHHIGQVRDIDLARSVAESEESMRTGDGDERKKRKLNRVLNRVFGKRVLSDQRIREKSDEKFEESLAELASKEAIDDSVIYATANSAFDGGNYDFVGPIGYSMIGQEQWALDDYRYIQAKAEEEKEKRGKALN